MRIATYNVHGGVPAGGHYDPAPACAVVRELDADVLALQEVVDDDFRGGRHDAFRALAAAHGGHDVRAPTLAFSSRTYGNALLSRWPVERHRVHDLSEAGREPRNLIEAVLRCPDGPLRVLATHLGLRAGERRRQVERIVGILRAEPGLRSVLLGDFNDWLPGSRLDRRLDGLLAPGPRQATFPVRLPLLSLDRIWLHPRPARLDVRVVRTPLARIASDHLPLVADVAW